MAICSIINFFFTNKNNQGTWALAATALAILARLIVGLSHLGRVEVVQGHSLSEAVPGDLEHHDASWCIKMKQTHGNKVT